MCLLLRDVEKRNENLEEMAPKGQKRTRKRDGDSGSEDENIPKRFISPSAKPQEATSSSQFTEDPYDLLDTTVPVHIYPDAVPPSAGEAVTEGASATTDSAPKEVSVALLETAISPVMSSPHIEFSSSSTIGEFSSSDENYDIIGGHLLPSPESISDSIESFSTPSGIRAFAQQPPALLDPAIVDVIPPTPENIAFPAARSVSAIIGDVWSRGSFDSPISIWSGESLHDIAGHEVWEEDGCSSHPPSDDDILDEDTLPSTPVLMLSHIDNDSAESTAISSKGKYCPSQEEVVALLNLRPSDVPSALTID